jgi:hypothetical protein
LEKEAQRKANKRKGRYQGLRALDRANFLKKLDKTFYGLVCANNSINPNLSQKSSYQLWQLLSSLFIIYFLKGRESQ